MGKQKKVRKMRKNKLLNIGNSCRLFKKKKRKAKKMIWKWKLSGFQVLKKVQKKWSKTNWRERIN
ncbi:ESF1 nucleolar pre-rRNA processing protein-like protein [Phyllostomus discolor]|uniref:ESF1 nucleolar pre-rRNA processing protein-like protein n=1 Tax=Phyllostomus discolor TaxID=89673 RepID=A0A834DQ18_9CHIR|nr:ESF1 nucleolar pre-rRNA processing protein-like protein [Phyllostomus discolor]